MFIQIFLLKLVLFTVIFSVLGGQSVSDYESTYYDDMISASTSNLGNFSGNLLVDNVDTSKDFVQDKIGNSLVGLKGTVYNVFMVGLGWIPLNVTADDYERMILIFINIFSLLITALAGYELFMIIWGKKTN